MEKKMDKEKYNEGKKKFKFMKSLYIILNIFCFKKNYFEYI